MFTLGIFKKISLEKCFHCFPNFKRKVENKFLLFSKFSLLKLQSENSLFSVETKNSVFSFLTSKHVLQIFYENEKFLFSLKIEK